MEYDILLIKIKQVIEVEPLTLSQIKARLFDKKINCDVRTIVKKIDTLKRLKFNITESVTRVGARKIPTKQFYLHYEHDDNIKLDGQITKRDNTAI